MEPDTTNEFVQWECPECQEQILLRVTSHILARDKQGLRIRSVRMSDYMHACLEPKRGTGELPTEMPRV